MFSRNINDRFNIFSEEHVSSPHYNDRLTSMVSCEWSKVETSRKEVFTREMSSGRIKRDVKMKKMRCEWNGVILHHELFFRFLRTLIMNDGIGWLHNTKSVDSLILIHNRWGVRNGRTQENTIWRINQMWGKRSIERVHMTTSRLASKICKYLKSRWGGRMWQFNRGVCMISHITPRWWSCLMRWRWIVTCDGDCTYFWLHSYITEVCLERFGYVKKILKSSIKKFSINSNFKQLVCKNTNACVKLFNRFIGCFL